MLDAHKKMLKDITPRLYQQTILNTCLNANTLVVLPTGLGKTVIALMLATQRLRTLPDSKVLFLAPTRPLVEQHLETFRKHFDIDESKLALFTGNVRPDKRAELWKTAQLIFSTPQGLENDIITGKISLEDISLIIFDEAHRAVGDYAYTFIAKEYDAKARYPRTLALTASPGSEIEKISEVCVNLRIEDVELRNDDDPDVKPYVQDVDIDWVKVSLPDEFRKVQDYLKKCYDSKLEEVNNLGFLDKRKFGFGKSAILKLQGFLHSEISRGDKSMDLLRSVSLLAEAMKAEHAIELLETQGISQLISYFENIYSEASSSHVKAVKNLARDINFKSAYTIARSLHERGVEHPKIPKLLEIVKDEVSKKSDVKIIIFTQYRESAKSVHETLSQAGISSSIFVGQMKKNGTGLSQKEQKAMLGDFRDGAFNCLIATSVAEEGIDIPRVDMVMFYEPVPSGIRTIQRRGRTGRQDKGRVLILMASGTRDEGYRWSAHRKERRMVRELEGLKKSLGGFARKKEKDTLEKWFSPEVELKIFADFREKASNVIKELHDMNIKLDLVSLKCGDYILSDRVGVEFKTVQDFVDSIVDGRLLAQIKELRESYERPILLIEGDQDIYSQRSIHPNAIRGMLATIMVSYSIPVFQTKDYKETSSLLAVIAKREQDGSGSDFSPHASRKPSSLRNQQEYVVSSLPGVGLTLARPLLEKFGSIKNIVNASHDDLKQVDKIGDKKAEDIKKVFDEKYDK
ncbi:TPA: DEAD/DEAH box helicase [Candidatus Woesearchaeota archaeon]|nr:DEAD/DEAH box helicase [Candidatus Woesearchaeota archaeon]